MNSSPSPADKRGLLLFAHGARDPQWARPFEAVALRCQAELGQDSVVLAFLEFMSPDLVTGGQKLIDAGCTTLDVVPLFLGAGGHVRRDLPTLLTQLQLANPAVSVALRPAVGESELLVQAMATIALDGLAAPGAP